MAMAHVRETEAQTAPSRPPRRAGRGSPGRYRSGRGTGPPGVPWLAAPLPELQSTVRPAVTASRSRSRWSAKPVRLDSWPASTASLQVGSLESRRSVRIYPKLRTCPAAVPSSGQRSLLQADAVVLGQGRGVAGEPASHLPYRRRPWRCGGGCLAQGGDLTNPSQFASTPRGDQMGPQPTRDADRDRTAPAQDHPGQLP